MNTETKICQNCKKDFTIESEDFDFYKKMDVPPPTFCPECRTQRRMLWRNEYFLFRRKDGVSEKEIFSTIPPHAPVPVYEKEYWWTDGWSPLDYGSDYDFSRPFFEQFKGLMREVPIPSRSIVNSINSDYSANANGLKNCYLIFDSNDCENCFYGTGAIEIKDSIDVTQSSTSELLYDVFGCVNCYKAFYSYDCGNCTDVVGCRYCVNCSNCVLCFELRNKQYCILNKQYTKDEYFKRLNELDISTRVGIYKIKETLKKISSEYPVKYALENHNTNISGNYISNSKNVHKSYMMRGCEDCKYCHILITPPASRQCMDYSLWGQGAELMYEVSQAGMAVSNIKFSAIIYENCRDILYSFFCISSSNCFGCIGLRNKQYCILNKQYTKEEYETLIPKIKKQMDDVPYIDRKGRIYKYGEFFPPELSPFAYNETIAQEHFPLTKEQTLEKGFIWKDFEEKDHVPTLLWNNLPKFIGEVDDKIKKENIFCRGFDEDETNAKKHGCTKAFRITSQELDFYKRFNIPLPEFCFYCRLNERTQWRNQMKLWKRTCQCAGIKSENGIYTNTGKHQHEGRCQNEFETSYAPDRKEIVYCEQCYQAEVV